jgi:hypothetical protein
MEERDIVELYGRGVLGDGHHRHPTSSQTEQRMSSFGHQGTPATETPSAAAEVSHLTSTRHEVVEYHEGDSRLPTRRRI